MIVTKHITVLVVLTLLTLRDLTSHLHVRGWRDVAADSSRKAVIQDVAAETIEICGADTVVVRCL